MKIGFLIVVAVLSVFILSLTGCPRFAPYADDKDKMERWRGARFGMFLHWGITRCGEVYIVDTS